MGASSFIVETVAENASDAFSRLVADARYEYGNDGYNGTISTCNMGRCVKSFAKYSQPNEKEAYKIIKSLDNGKKWIAQYIDLGVEYCVIRTAKKVNAEYTAKYAQKFAVVDCDTERVITNAVYDTKPPADEQALKLALKGKSVCVKKTMVKLRGSDVVSKFSCEEKTVKTMPKKIDNKKTVVVPMHRYLFFGWAAE